MLAPERSSSARRITWSPVAFRLYLQWAATIRGALMAQCWPQRIGIFAGVREKLSRFKEFIVYASNSALFWKPSKKRAESAPKMKPPTWAA